MGDAVSNTECALQKARACAKIPAMENVGFKWSTVHRLGIIGGTFDPIHHGHLVAAEQVRQGYDLDRVVFIPSGRPPHKIDAEISSAKDRYLMGLLAIIDSPRFCVSLVELMREEIAYTIDTLRQLRSWTGPHCELYFIAGADMALDLPTWREPDAVLDECRFIAVQRPGYDLASIEQVLGANRAAKVEVVAAPTPDISATDIRKRVAAGKSIAGLTPEPVSQYIAAAGLYIIT